MSLVQIEPIPSIPRYLKTFIKFAWEIYKDDPNWVPPLILDHLKRLDPTKDPYHKHSESQLFLARRDGKIVGRIAASIDRLHNETHQEKTGFCGFFECINDVTVAKALFDAAGQWLKSRGMTIMRGPANFTSNQEWSLLIQGFDRPPHVMMTYNPRYYMDLFDSYGFKKAKDLFAFYRSTATDLDPRISKIAEHTRKKHNIKVRTVNMKKFKEELNLVKDIYRSAWEKNWGFIPMTDEEIEYAANDLKQIIIPELMLFAEVNGEAVGFSVTLPDINQALKKINGRLFPFGIFKFLYYLRKVDDSRLLLLGIKEAYRRRGIDSIFYIESFSRAKAMGIRGGEMSWTLEDNTVINKAMEALGGDLYKKYRVYDYALA